MQQSFHHDEAEEILARAVRHQSEQGGFLLPGEEAGHGRAVSQQQLTRMAAELGVSPEALAAAQSEWQSQRLEARERKEYDRKVRGDWTSHLTAYAIINAFLMAMDFWMTRGITWSIFPLLGWGIGLAFDTVSTFNKSDEDYEKGFAKWRKKRRKEREKAGE